MLFIVAHPDPALTHASTRKKTDLSNAMDISFAYFLTSPVRSMAYAQTAANGQRRFAYCTLRC